jgi:hypothetical protein
MMELAYIFFSVISLRKCVKIDVTEMYCFFKNPVTYDVLHKKKSSSTWRFSADHCMFLWLFTFSVNLLTTHICMCNHRNENSPRKIHFICTGNRKFTTFLRHATQSLFYFPLFVIYFITVPFSVQVMLMIL